MAACWLMGESKVSAEEARADLDEKIAQASILIGGTGCLSIQTAVSSGFDSGTYWAAVRVHS